MNRFMCHLAGNGWSHFIFGPAFEKGFSHSLGPKRLYSLLQSGQVLRVRKPAPPLIPDRQPCELTSVNREGGQFACWTHTQRPHATRARPQDSDLRDPPGPRQTRIFVVTFIPVALLQPRLASHGSRCTTVEMPPSARSRNRVSSHRCSAPADRISRTRDR